MMKKIFITFIVIVFIFIMFLLFNKEVLIINNDYVVMEAKYVSNDEVLITLTNKTENDYMYGNYYYIQVYENDKWKTLDAFEDIAFTVEGYILKSYDVVELTIYIDNYLLEDDKLYRIIKEINIMENEVVNTENINISAEFKIA